MPTTLQKTKQHDLKIVKGDFPGGPGVKTSPSNAGSASSRAGQRALIRERQDPTCLVAKA